MALKDLKLKLRGSSNQRILSKDDIRKILSEIDKKILTKKQKNGKI